MNKSENNQKKQFAKEVYKINIIPQGNRPIKDLLKELILQSLKTDHI